MCQRLSPACLVVLGVFASCGGVQRPDGDPARPPSKPSTTSAAPRSIHKAFAEKKCKACHTKDESGRTVPVGDRVCDTCHAPGRIVPKHAHAPVADGQCRMCHHPHRASEAHLLLKPAHEVCGRCHDVKAEGWDRRHRTLPLEVDCTKCHSGHGTPHPGFLHTMSAALCSTCHDIDLGRRRYVHGPVTESCGTCHTSHSSTVRFHLARPGDALCADCHAKDEMARLPRHKDAGAKTCLDCHHPHASNRPGLMR